MPSSWVASPRTTELAAAGSYTGGMLESRRATMVCTSRGGPAGGRRLLNTCSSQKLTVRRLSNPDQGTVWVWTA